MRLRFMLYAAYLLWSFGAASGYQFTTVATPKGKRRITEVIINHSAKGV